MTQNGPRPAWQIARGPVPDRKATRDFHEFFADAQALKDRHDEK